MYAFGLTKSDARAIAALPAGERKPSRFLRVLDVPVPSPKEDEVLVRVKGAGLNFNSVWSAICLPADPFSLISGHVNRNKEAADHLLDYAIFGSDGAGIIAAVGSSVKGWKEGDEAVIHCNVVGNVEPWARHDEMRSRTQSIWGYETNFGSFAEFTKVKASQLLPKPPHLNWAQAGSYCLTLATAYRMLLSQNGAKLRPGENCLIWGAAGGLGSFAIQLCKLAGATPVAIVSSAEKAAYCRQLGCELIINLSEVGKPTFLDANGLPDYLAWRKFRQNLEQVTQGSPIDVVFEHIGRDTLGLSVYLLRKGGRVVTCAASSGYVVPIDLRYLWMEVKSIIGSHFANHAEALAANRLMIDARVAPCTTQAIEFSQIPDYLDRIMARGTIGKIGIAL